MSRKSRAQAKYDALTRRAERQDGNRLTPDEAWHQGRLSDDEMDAMGYRHKWTLFGRRWQKK